jgi:GNAT superfamily N-acetyltransferase
MALLFKQGAATQFNLQDFEPSFGEKFGAVIDETLLENPTYVGFKNLQLATDNGEKLSADEANSFLKQYPFRLDLNPKDGQYSQSQLRTLAERQRELRMVQDIRDRTPWDYGSPIRFIGMLGASMVDPINIASAFVPWTRTITAARSLEAARLSSSAGTRFLGRASLGAIDGGISTAVIEPFYFLGRTNLGDDYDALDSMANIAFGSVIGGGVLGIGGVGVDQFRRMARREIPSDRFAGMATDDIQLVLALDAELKAGPMTPTALRAVLESYTPEMRKAAGFPSDLPDIRARDPRSEASLVTRSDDGLEITVSSKAGTVTAATDGTNLRITSATVFDSMQRKGHGTALLERTVNEGLDDGMSVSSDATVPTGLARAIEALERKGFVVTKNTDTVDLPSSDALPGGGIRSLDLTQPVYRIERGENYQRPEMTAQDQIDIMSPDTREATFRAGLAQALQGYGLSIDPIVKTDAAFGATTTAADVKKNADISLRPENIRAADFESSDNITVENRTSQGWDGLSDAETAAADADVLLDQTIAAGDQAYKYSRNQEGLDKPSVAVGNKLGTAKNAIEVLTSAFGRNTKSLVNAGQLRIVNKVSDLPGGPHPADVKGWAAPDNVVYIVAENVSAPELRGLVLHEVGVHVGMKQMLGAEVYESVLKELDDAIMKGKSWTQSARDSVPTDTPSLLVREEQLAYLVQNAPELPLVQRIIAAVRAWAFRTFKTARERMQLTEADFRALAISGLKFAARQQIQARNELGNFYSRGTIQDPSTAKSELDPADAKVERAKSYAGVLRAAADKLENDAQAVDAMRSQMPDITAQEIDELLVGLRTQVKNLRGMGRKSRDMLMAGDAVTALQAEAMQAADMLANNLQMAAVIERRNAALNLNARLKASAFINQFREKGLDFEGFAALLVGSERVRIGARMSIDAEYKGFRGEFVGGLLADMEKAGLNQAFISGRFDRDIYDALWRLGSDQPDMAGLSPEVVRMAEVINKYQTVARNRRNRFGAWIRDLQGYATRQTHDMFKIRAVTQAEWVSAVKDSLDLPKMIRLGLIDETDPIGSLKSLYNDFASGSHMKPMAAEEDIVALGRGSNLAKRESVSRTLYFKDGLAAYDYHAKFGVGRLAESIIIGLDRSASSAAQLKTLGTNPMATLTRLLDEYEESLKTTPDRFDKFRSQRGAIMNLLAQVDGSVNIPGSVQAAKINSFIRSWTSMAKLGGALISSISDLTGYAAELRYAQNKNMLSGMVDGIGALTRGRAKGEKAEILSSLGVFYESVSGAVSARFDNPELVAGKMAATMRTFFRLNGLTWWTEVLRDGTALSHSHYMAQQGSKNFGDIDPELRRLFTLYNIDEGKWDLLRMGQMKTADGRAYLTPDALNTVPQEAFENYIRSIGRTVSPASVQNLIDDLGQTMRTMFLDRAHHAVLEPNARNRAFMLRGTKPGTVPGEILRYISQFKSFSVAITQSVLGREVYGRGYDTFGEYLRKGQGDWLGMAYMISLYGLLGYGAMSVKDLIKGREPRNPLNPQTVIASLAQGGGLGLYGDFLFGEYSRFGKSLVSSIAGPVAGAADTIAELYTRARNGDDLAGTAFKAILDNTPFNNLFWLRPLLDYTILFNIQESMNPGFLRRMERRVERQNDQRFLFKPSEVIR